VRVARMPMSYLARALEVDESRGLMNAGVDADSGQILGFAVLGIEGGELMAAVAVAMLYVVDLITRGVRAAVDPRVAAATAR